MKRYQDFAVRIDAVGDTHRAIVVDGRASGSEEFSAPFTDQEATDKLATLTRQIEAAINAPGPEVTKELDRVQTAIGERLYEALLAGAVERAFDLSRGAVESERRDDPSLVGTRLKLVFEPDRSDLARVASLPWELLFDRRSRDYLGRTSSYSIVRYLENRRLKHPSSPVDGKLRVLLVDSEPNDVDAIDGAEERARIKAALKDHPSIEVEEYEQPDLGTLRDRLRFGGFHVLHFIGHGGFDPVTGEGQIALVAEDGSVRPVTGALFAENLKDIASLQLVVLNSCENASQPSVAGVDPFMNVAPALIMAGVPAVVAMQFPISDDAAIAFSTEFYDKLGRCSLVEFAVAEGRLAILREERAAFEWATPVLFSSLEQGELFVRDQPTRGLSPAAVATPSPLRLGITTSIHGAGRDHGARIAEHSDRVLRLDEYFEGRRIRDDAHWHEAILPKLSEFLFRAADAQRPLHLDLAAHSSIAFAAGYFLEAKSGLDITIRQRGLGGSTDWTTGQQPPDGPLWTIESEQRVGAVASADIAVAVSVTTPITPEVRDYMSKSALDVSRLIPVSLAAGAGNAGIESGAHALRLAQLLRNDLREQPRRGRGTLHLFASAPNGFMFFFGQLARHLGSIQLYEFDFDHPDQSIYWPSIRLPFEHA